MAVTYEKLKTKIQNNVFDRHKNASKNKAATQA